MYVFHADTNPATIMLLEEAAVTFAQLSGKEVSGYVTVEDFQHYWQRANKQKSSSHSGLHFGH